MKCPVCKLDMTIKSKGNVINPVNNLTYFRNIYWCQFHDIWLSLELPAEGAEEFIRI